MIASHCRSLDVFYCLCRPRGFGTLYRRCRRRAMISPICPTQKERPRGPPQTNIWGESLVGLPTRLDLMERRGIDYHRRRVFVCPGSICSYNLRHTIPSRRRVLSFRQLLLSSLVKKTAQVCSKWGAPPPPTNLWAKARWRDSAGAVRYGRRPGRRFLRQSQSSPS